MTQGLLNKTPGIVLFIALFFGFIYNPYTHFPYTFLILSLLILVHQYAQNATLSGLGFKRLTWSDARIILAAFLLLEGIMDFIIQPLFNRIFNEPVDYSAFAPIAHHTSKYFKYLIFMWISAAIGEELFFRGYLFSQLEKLFGQKPWLIIGLSALFFGIPHFYQGLSGFFTTMVFGIGFGFLYHRYRNIWINIIVHGLIDTLFLTLAFYDKLSYYELLNRLLSGH